MYSIFYDFVVLCLLSHVLYAKLILRSNKYGTRGYQDTAVRIMYFIIVIYDYMYSNNV